MRKPKGLAVIFRRFWKSLGWSDEQLIEQPSTGPRKSRQFRESMEQDGDWWHAGNALHGSASHRQNTPMYHRV